MKPIELNEAVKSEKFIRLLIFNKLDDYVVN